MIDASLLEPQVVIPMTALVSGAALLLTQRAIPGAMQTLYERGIYGIDINKTTAEQRKAFGEAKRSGQGQPEEMKKRVVPESLGIVVGPIYLCAVSVCMLAAGLPLAKVNASLCTIAFGLLLGFVDDVLDVRWRHKIVFSIFATLPLIAAYDGSTSIVIPLPLRGLVGASVLWLGPVYVVYIAMLCIFCTNSINILAGVNGVEVGQSLLIALAQITHNVLQLYRGPVADRGPHLLSLVLLLPFVACSYGLWRFNRYPSRVFIGDSYTYFAGMTLAVAGISGGYSKTLLLFFAPQVFNFVISIPQLFGYVECPRHRVPRWNPETGLLENSRNLTILNAVLAVTGPLHERSLTRAIMVVQAVCIGLAFVVRYTLAGMIYDEVH